MSLSTVMRVCSSREHVTQPGIVFRCSPSISAHLGGKPNTVCSVKNCRKRCVDDPEDGLSR